MTYLEILLGVGLALGVGCETKNSDSASAVPVVEKDEAPASAPPGPPMAGPRRAPMYDPATVDTVDLEVTEIIRVPHGGRGVGVHILARIEGDDVEVHLGPDWYLAQQGLEPEVGDSLQVRGSRIELGGKTVLLARDVTAGDRVFNLRDEQGVPAWRGGRGRRGPPSSR